MLERERDTQAAKKLPFRRSCPLQGTSPYKGLPLAGDFPLLWISLYKSQGRGLEHRSARGFEDVKT